MKFNPHVLDGDGIDKLVHLIRSYFKLDGHHIQFNVIGAETLRKAQQSPEKYRDLIVRVAGYSDYFVDIGQDTMRMRMIKSEEEIELIRNGARIADIGGAACVEAIGENLELYLKDRAEPLSRGRLILRD